ncbi:DUF484 family protein [Actimicrobium antarcticum]|uniref:DUF484 family protein n=1 Tax=Actimicrobium antarcticum TaxID=1051899 RepID=A0ABP7T9J1_9BURK
MTYQPDSDSVAKFLEQTPEFFQEHAELLGRVKLSSPLGGRTLSLQERQMDVMRQKVKLMEMRLADLMRLAEENHAISDKIQHWTRSLLLARNDVDLPHVLVEGLKTTFSVPQATLRIWTVAPDFSHTWFAAPVSEDARLFAGSLHAPFCGRNDDYEAASWLDEASSVQSIAMLPLRVGAAPEVFGILVLGSADPLRFASGMGTDFLTRIGETSSAALTCLLD